MDVRQIPSSTEYRKIQNFINSSSKIDEASNETQARKSKDTVSKVDVAETKHLGQRLNTYA